MGEIARVITGKPKSAPAPAPALAPAPEPAAPAADAGRSEMAERTAASMRARRRGPGRSLLGGEDQRSTLG